jgi:N6-adenosine-specific RNA methylase IME4
MAPANVPTDDAIRFLKQGRGIEAPGTARRDHEAAEHTPISQIRIDRQVAAVTPVLAKYAPLASNDERVWSTRIRAALHKSVECVLEVGRLLKEAKAKLPPRSFLTMIERDLPFTPRMAQLYMAVASNPRFANAKCISHLPSSIGTLSDIGNLPNDIYERLCLDGSINPAMTRPQVSNIIANEKTRRLHEHIARRARKHDLGGGRFIFGLVAPPLEGNVSRRGTSPYPRLSVDDICKFAADDGRPIRDLFATTAILYMWVIDGHLFAIPRIFEAWGFKFCRTMVWPKASIGLGQLARHQHELVCIGTRGQFTPAETDLRHSTVIVAETLDTGVLRCAPPHDERHSSKPSRLQEMIERAYPQYFKPDAVDDPVAIELFSRAYRPGWAGQGWEYPGRPRSNIEQSPTRDVASGHTIRLECQQKRTKMKPVKYDTPCAEPLTPG